MKKGSEVQGSRFTVQRFSAVSGSERPLKSKKKLEKNSDGHFFMHLDRHVDKNGTDRRDFGHAHNDVSLPFKINQKPEITDALHIRKMIAILEHT